MTNLVQSAFNNILKLNQPWMEPALVVLPKIHTDTVPNWSRHAVISIVTAISHFTGFVVSFSHFLLLNTLSVQRSCSLLWVFSGVLHFKTN